MLPITGLPSDYGIGCFSREAFEFVDMLKAAGQAYWQILPMGPAGAGDSPYQSISCYAGNPYLIDLTRLTREDLLKKEECDECCFAKNERYVDYGMLYQSRLSLLGKAFERYDAEGDANYKRFCENEKHWLEDYALFSAIKEYNGGAALERWESGARLGEEREKYRDKLCERVEFYKFIQFKFYEQWERLKTYANKNGIKIIGDLPIYVSADSVEVWSHPELFKLDTNKAPTVVAGCPPDGFSPRGQLWGNPVYNWEMHKKEKFGWWLDRIEHNLRLYDVVRIDHFRGFDEYYQIPSDADDASEGEWVKAPGEELFEQVKQRYGEGRFIAEDLGFVTQSVKELLEKCGFLGMRVLQFAFDVRDTGMTSDYLPHNYIENCVAYTGTHDNQTLRQWFCDELSEKEKNLVRAYLCDKYTPDEKMNLPLIGAIMRSAARICIVPLADYMGLGGEARINIPSTVGENWRWRLKKGEANEELFKTIGKITRVCQRG